MEYNFFIYGKIFKGPVPIKIRYCFFNIVNISLNPRLQGDVQVGGGHECQFYHVWYYDGTSTLRHFFYLKIYAIITFWFVQIMRSMHWHRVITWLSLSVICLYPADDVRKSISYPVNLVMSFFHRLEHLTLKLPEINELNGNSLFILLIRK